MKSCPDVDVLLAIGAAVDWDIEDGVRHLTTCPECRERLGSLSAVRNAMAAEEAPVPGFADRVMQSLPGRTEVDFRRSSLTIDLVNASFAGVTALGVARMAATTGNVELWAAGVLAVACAGATLWWNRAEGRREPAGSPS